MGRRDWTAMVDAYVGFWFHCSPDPYNPASLECAPLYALFCVQLTDFVSFYVPLCVSCALWCVSFFVSLCVSHRPPVRKWFTAFRHDTDCIQARDRAYTNCVCTVGVPASYRRAKGAPPLKPECGSTNLNNASQNENLMVRNYNLMFGCVGVIT